VERLRFFLNKRGTLDADDATGAGNKDAVVMAIEQALHGDVRLAQGLAAKYAHVDGGAPVVADFDLLRSGVSTTTHLGVKLLNMFEFANETTIDQGSVQVQTQAGDLGLLWDSKRKLSKAWRGEHSFNRMGVAAISYDAAMPGAARADANLYLQVEDQNKNMDRARMLKHLDALILGLGGQAAFDAVDQKGTEIERAVDKQCNGSEDNLESIPCATNEAMDGAIAQMRSDGLAAVDAAIGSLPQKTHDLVHAAALLRLAAQSVYEPASVMIKGANADLVNDLRLDDGALHDVLVGDGTTAPDQRFRSAMVNYLSAVDVDRGASPDKIASKRAGIESKYDSQLSALTDTYRGFVTQYRFFDQIEHAQIQNLGKEMGARAVIVPLTVDANNAVQLQSATADSTSHQRAALAVRWFDALVQKAKGLGSDVGLKPEQAVIYAILGMLPASRLDVGSTMTLNISDKSQYAAGGYAGFDVDDIQGDDVNAIDGGMFDIDALITGPQTDN
jgi:hypothetical protein